MVITNQIIFIFLALLFILGVIFAIVKVMRDPKNKGKEFGHVVLELILSYPKSIFLSMLLWFGVAEALLAASSDHSDVSPVARMMTHSGMAILAFFAGTVWIKELTELSEAVKQRSAVDILISLWLVSIVTILTIGTPIANLLVIANNLGEADQLSLFWHRIQVAMGLRSVRTYMAELYAMGLPLDYNALKGLSGAMLASIFVTVVTLLLIMWEAGKIARSNRESTKNILRSDLGKDPAPPSDKDKGKGDDKGKEDDKGKGAKQETSAQEILKRLLAFTGLKDDVLTNKAKTAYEVLISKDETTQASIIAAMGKLVQETARFSGDGKEKAELVDKIVTQFKKGPKQGGLGMTINPPSK